MGTRRFLTAVLGLVLGVTCGRWAAAAEPPAGDAAKAAPRQAKAKPIKNIYIMTDMEGVAGVRDADQWLGPTGRYYDLGRKLLTLELNAAIEGFFAGGATRIVVCDGHGGGAIDIEYLDPRVEMERGWPNRWPGPSLASGEFDAVAWVGQHAKAGTEFAHLAHTQSFGYVDLSVNGVSIGEFGQLALCAGELGVRPIFGSGDKAFTEEAQALAPGIETVWVKRGTTPGRGDELAVEAYGRRNAAAIHLHPQAARARIREGAQRAIRRAQQSPPEPVVLKPPYERITRFRPKEAGQPITVSKETHPTSVTALINLPFHAVPEPKR